METTKLNELFALLHIPCVDDREIKGISDDSREVEKDWLFVCRKGVRHNGVEYIQDALDAGAVVLCDECLKKENVYRCANVEVLIQVLLTMYYGDLCAHLCVIGITGTNGKSSVAGILSQILRKEEKAVLQLGTHEVLYPDVQEETMNTTPNAFQLANYFRRAIQQGITHVVMEVSSHAIDQNRICFLQFDCIVYTNIAQDHLDYHLTKTHYRYTKFKLRRYLKNDGVIVVNSDYPYMMELVHLAHHPCITIGCKEAHFPIRDIVLSDHDSKFSLQGYDFQLPLLSKVNVYNVAQAVAVCRRLHISYERLQLDLAEIEPIPGRLEVIQVEGRIIWIDYAHTQKALEALLVFANQVKQGSLYCVIGCGGNREKEKRSQMAKTACLYSDVAIFTADNPRYERICDILYEMCKIKEKNYAVFENRAFAIKHAVKMSQNSDIIVIAGKGNEHVQEIKGERLPFDDKSCVCELLARRN